jgi:molecular chaperone GrpE (heat shock protein)
MEERPVEMEEKNETAYSETTEAAATDETALDEQDIEAMRTRLQAMERELEEQRNLYLRTLADFQNYRRRQQDEMERGRLRLLEA